MLKLQADHPEFRAIISDLIIARLPDNVPMSGLDPLMLDALVRRGAVEVQRPENQQADAKILNCAVAAAKELIGRPISQTDAGSAENASFLPDIFTSGSVMRSIPSTHFSIMSSITPSPIAPRRHAKCRGGHRQCEEDRR